MTPLLVASTHTKTAFDGSLIGSVGALPESTSYVFVVYRDFRADRNEYFKNPVSRAEVPDYYEKIKKPMCWSVIEGKLERHEYWDLQTFKVGAPWVLGCADLPVIRMTLPL